VPHNRSLVAQRALSPIAVIAAAALASCAYGTDLRGHLPSSDELAQIHPGKTTKDQVVKILGTPSTVGVFDDKDWYYISSRTKDYTFASPKILDQQVYVVAFNDDGVVRAVEHKTLQDGREVVPIARATPAPGRELTFLEQVLGNLGRFNNTGGGGGGEAGGGETRAPGPATQSEE
jgi:outer membrane protein assembly factor BamE (lipoprotein component of BamABCDE complex)